MLADDLDRLYAVLTITSERGSPPWEERNFGQYKGYELKLAEEMSVLFLPDEERVLDTGPKLEFVCGDSIYHHRLSGEQSKRLQDAILAGPMNQMQLDIEAACEALRKMPQIPDYNVKVGAVK